MKEQFDPETKKVSQSLRDKVNGIKKNMSKDLEKE